MGFFNNTKEQRPAGPSVDILHQLGCKVCPLNKLTNNRNPHMEPTGSDTPDIYILGDAPNQNDDASNKQFVGTSGQLLRVRLDDSIPTRWNNVVRTRPWKNAAPQKVEIECCRPSVEKDIAATKPKAIFGFGPVPLQWVSGFVGITEWRGRRMPVTIAGHKCWYYSFSHPYFLLKSRPDWASGKSASEIGSENERAFAFDIERALSELEDLPIPEIHTKEQAEEGVEVITSFTEVIEVLRWACEQKEAGLDFETEGGRPYAAEARILTIAISTGTRSVAFGLDHPECGWTDSQRASILAAFVTFLCSQCIKYVHHLAYEMEWIAVLLDKRLLRQSQYHCSMMMASSLDERRGKKDRRRAKNEKGPLALDFLCRQKFGLSLKALSKVNVRSLSKEPLHAVLKYNAMDAKYHLLVGRALKSDLKRYGLWKVYRRGLRRIATTVLTQIQGLPISLSFSRGLRGKYERGIEKATAEIQTHDILDKFKKKEKHAFDPGSNKDTVILFRDILKCREGFTIDKRSKKEKYEVTEDVLKKLPYPIAGDIIKLRKIQKKYTTYLYDAHVWPDGLVHANFHPGYFTNTFRGSSDDPNLQNIPKRQTGNKEVRKQIKAFPGHSFIAIDYGQIEARVIAMASKDPAFVKSFWDRTDVHMKWALIIAKAYPDRIGGRKYLEDKAVMKDFRTSIKNEWTFPLFFGAQLSSAAEYLDIPPEKIEAEYHEFQEEYRGVFEWQKKLKQFYYKNGYVESLFGRRRRAPLSGNKVINTPIQCTMGEMVFEAWSDLSEHAQETNDWYFNPRIMIHDDLTFMVPTDRLDYYVPRIVEMMLSIDRFDFVNVPITLEVSVGKTLFPYDKDTYPHGMFEIFKASSDKSKEYEWSKEYDEWLSRQ